MKRVLIAFGTRPEAIKMAPLVKQFQCYSSQIETVVCVTGQHREMLDQVLELFEIAPDFDLNIMQKGQNLYDVTSRVLNGMGEILRQVHPDVVLVHGDTTTSMAAALASYYEQIPVGHVEAGLRTNNIYSPWPEEMNRQITGRIAAYNFSPTVLSRENLLRENVTDNSIVVTGNTVIDALHYVVDKIEGDTQLASQLRDKIASVGYDLRRLDNDSRRMVLITGHRRENFGSGFKSICMALLHLAERFPMVDFVYPMHLNPNVRRPISEIMGDKRLENLIFIEPLDYFEFVNLMRHSYIVLTDSGGIQEEAPGLGKPVLVMRDTTERPEAVEAGTVKLVGTDYDKIVLETTTLLSDSRAYEAMSRAVNPYGDGKASDRIVKKMLEYLGV